MALRLRLGKPAGKLETDHWDRVGAVGLMLPSAPELQAVQVISSTPSKELPVEGDPL